MSPRRRLPILSVLATAIVALAIAIRAARLFAGLPDFLEEAIPLRLALAMRDVATGRVDWNPHSFNYPSLSIYLHFAVQQGVFAAGQWLGHYHGFADYLLAFQLDPTPMVVAARVVGIACDAFVAWGVFRIGERLARGAGLVAAALVAVSPILVTTSSSIFCDSIMAALAVWAVERMLAWHERPSWRGLVAAAALVGLATGAKYPAATLLVPLAWLVAAKQGRDAVPACAVAAGVAALAFLATTPFAVLDAAAFARDVGFERAHAVQGHLGSVGHRSFAFQLDNLLRSVSGVGVALLLLSPFVFRLDRERRPLVVALWVAVLAFGLPISLARIDAARYIVPVVPFAAVLAAATAMTLGTRPGARTVVARGIAIVACAAMVGGVAVQGVAAMRAGRSTTQAQARRWCEAHTTPGELIVQEGYSARLTSAVLVQELRESPVYALASPVRRARLDARRAFHAVSLPLAVSGAIVNRSAVPGAPPVTFEVLPHADALNRVFYDPRLFVAADWFMTSSAVRGRFEADPARYPVECAFYRLLDRDAPAAVRFVAGTGVDGPEIAMHRLGPAFRAAVAARGAFDPVWWWTAVPAATREHVAMMARHSREPDPRRWLAPMYAQRIQPFVVQLDIELVTLGRDAAACDLASASLAMDPTDPDAAMVYAACTARMGRWREGRLVVERAIAGVPPSRVEPALVLAHARTLAHTGAVGRAAAELASLASRLPADDAVAVAARRLRARLAAPPPAATLPAALAAQ